MEVFKMGLAVIMAIVGLIVGWVSCYFVMRNNLKYFNIDDMAKSELRALLRKIKDRL